jgi:glutamate synthase domain-containing protein 1/glutamate synthase domain-containing protein 3
MNRDLLIKKVLKSRERLAPSANDFLTRDERVAEGGCGVIGIACNEQIPARHLLQSLSQMRNRGNGKGGGIAAVGLNPDEFGVSKEVLGEDYLLTIAYLDSDVRQEVETKYILGTYHVDYIREMPHIQNHLDLDGLDIQPPEVTSYFVRVKSEVYDKFANDNNLDGAQRRLVEDEIVYQNSFSLNKEFYASTGETRAFVLSHGKNMLVLKMVGYGDDVIRYYQLEDIHAHVWIGHHRYPTKGRVWHPGGAHPFVGLNEALVHNGDFANYASMAEYLAQRNIYPLFLTDTEVSVLVFDLYHRTYGYPLEYVIEALAPTTERDFTLLPDEKQRIYEMIQQVHMHGSPDGPWFFLIAQSVPEGECSNAYRLIGITDTSMLRPQVFALQETGENGPAIGLAASEKQAIDAALVSLAEEDNRFWTRADKYWNARGGSHTDGGAFIFSVNDNGKGNPSLTCTDKFNNILNAETTSLPENRGAETNNQTTNINQPPIDPDISSEKLFNWFIKELPKWEYQAVRKHIESLLNATSTDEQRSRTFEVLTLLIDQRYPIGEKRRSSLLSIYDEYLESLVKTIRKIPSPGYVFVNVDTPTPTSTQPDQTIIIDARGFQPEGQNSLAQTIISLYSNGFRKFIITNVRGHRFIGNGLGPNSNGVRIDVYGSSGDYLASGLDGVELYVHGSAQDQLAQIMKSGKLVVYGDVGQTLGYAAKGGEIFILGNAAGRPMINAVGKPRVVINGTCLDYLAESFMAGDPHNGGGFVIINGIAVNDEGIVHDLETPYPGGNIFSLASGGAIFIRDTDNKLSSDQLNGGKFSPIENDDWQLIKPYLEENARLFNIPLDKLLNEQPPNRVYRKIIPRKVRALQAEEAWVRKGAED